VKYLDPGYRIFSTKQPASPVLVVLTTAFVLSACSGSSSGGRATTDADGSAPATVSLNVSNSLIVAGETVTLNWSSRHASSCTASGGWNGVRPLSGSEVVGPLSRDTAFTLSCSGTGGGGLQQVIVQIDDGSGGWVQLNASPRHVTSGGNSTLSWNASGATGCAAGGGWSGSRAASGSYTAGPIVASTTYRLSCEGPNGTGIGMVTVEVVDKILRWQAPTQNVDGSALTDLSGYVIYWGTSSRRYTDSHAINSPTTTQWEVTVPAGSYYFAMTALDSENNESGYSNELLKVIPE